MNRLKNLMEDRAKVWDQMQGIRAAATTEKRSELTGEERAAWDKAETDLAALSADIEREQRANALEKTITAGVKFVEDENPELRQKVDPDVEYRAAFEQWARNGTGDLAPEQRKMLQQGFVAAQGELRALGVGTGGAGGYAVPALFRDTLIETMKYYNAVRQVATIITTDSGALLPWPVNNDTANVGAILAENTAISQQDVALTQETLNAWMYTSKLVLVSYQLLQDSAIDISTFLARKLGQRIGRIQNQHFTTGTGSSQPLGIATSPTVGYTAPTGNTTTMTYAGLIATEYSLDPAYRNGGNVKWMMSDTALAAVRSLVSTTGAPIWSPSVVEGQPDLLAGHGIVVNNDLPVPAANATPVLFGDFAAGYVIRDVTGVQTVRLDERYADFLQVGWFAYQRSDGTVQDTAAIRAYKNSAT